VAENVFEAGIAAAPERAPTPIARRPAPASPPRTSLVAAIPSARPADIPASLPVAASTPATTPRAATQSPPTLELVTILPTTGTRAPDPRPISRTEAVAAVMASPEFRGTLEPLARLYLATFGRYPDYDGINFYTGQREEARPLGEIANDFARSREFEQRYGALDNEAFVERIFLNVLGNTTQADVRGYWVEELNSGRMTRGEVLVDLSESGAFRERSANEIFVSTAYVEILHRTPDPDGYSRWVATLNAGQPYRTVIDGLLAGR
jgi:hypothetical protein